MAMSLQMRIQSEIEKFQNAIQGVIVPLQKTVEKYLRLTSISLRRFTPSSDWSLAQTWLCMADCCDPKISPEAIDRCYQKCRGSMQQADNHVQFTMQNLQSRIQQCEMECQDKPSQQEFESCMNSKAGKVLDQFPNDTDELLSKLRAIWLSLLYHFNMYFRAIPLWYAEWSCWTSLCDTLTCSMTHDNVFANR